MNERRLEAPINFLAQAAHLHVDDLGFRFEAVFPNAFKEHRPGDGLPGVPHQELKQAELARHQYDLDIGALYGSV